MPILADLLGTSAQPRVSGLPRQRGSWGLVKPVQGSSIDWGHPLAKGLIFATILDGSGAVVDLTTGVRTLKPQTHRLGSGGTGSNSTSANATKIAAPRLIRPANAPVSAFTVTTQFRSTTTSDFESGINASAYTSESINQGWGLSTRGGAGTQGFAFVLLNNNGEGVYALLHSNAAPWGTLNVPVTWGGTYDGTTGILYVNGLSRTSTALSYAAAAAGTTTTIASTDGGSPNFAFHLGYAWDRELQPSEMAWLNAEPYAMFAPPGPKRNYTFFSAPATQPVRRRTATWGNVKPPAGTPINWGHPLAQGLEFVSTGTKESVVGSVQATLSGSGNAFADSNGWQIRDASANSIISWHNTQTFNRAYNSQRGMTLVALATLRSISGGAYHLLTRDHAAWNVNTPPGGTNRVWQFRANSSGAIGLVLFNDGVSAPVNFFTSRTYLDSAPHLFVARTDFGTASATSEVVVDGVVQGAGTFVGTHASNFDKAVGIGNSDTTTNSVATPLLLVYSRKLSLEEIRWLTAEPYAMFTPPQTLSQSFSLESPPSAIVVPPFVGNLVTGGNLKLHSS